MCGGNSQSTISAMPTDTIVIRRAIPSDGPALTRLALLDGARALRGTILIAESAGELRAAWSIEERRGAADPFQETAGEMALLRTRAASLDSHFGRRRRLSLRSKGSFALS